MSFNYFRFPTATKSLAKNNSFNLHFDLFLLNSSVFCFYGNKPKYYNFFFYLEPKFMARYALLSSVSMSMPMIYLVDASQFRVGPNEWSIIYNWSDMSSDTRISVFTEITYFSYEIPSISSIYRSAAWLEREISDFTNLLFIGSVDTRRLLLDYLSSKHSWETHTDYEKSFDNCLYEIINYDNYEVYDFNIN